MPGRYENFPQVVHGLARFNYQSSRRKLQQAILRTLHQLNRETCGLDKISPFSSSGCEVSFEVGVADGTAFSYVDKEETGKLREAVLKGALPILDFLCVVRYHVNKGGKHVALKFDYHLLRFAFHRKNVELRAFHERGPRRVSPEDLLIFLTKYLNKELLRNRLKPVTVQHLQAL